MHGGCTTLDVQLPTSAGELATLIYSCHVGIRCSASWCRGYIVTVQRTHLMLSSESTQSQQPSGYPDGWYQSVNGQVRTWLTLASSGTVIRHRQWVQHLLVHLGQPTQQNLRSIWSQCASLSKAASFHCPAP